MRSVDPIKPSIIALQECTSFCSFSGAMGSCRRAFALVSTFAFLNVDLAKTSQADFHK